LAASVKGEGILKLCSKAAKADTEPEFWKNADAQGVAAHCLLAMSSVGYPTGIDSARLQWRGNFLCLATQSGYNIPSQILSKVFLERNICDADALTIGLRLYSSAEPKGQPVLVLATRKPGMTGPYFKDQKQVQFKPERTTPVGHEIDTKGLLNSVLRCLSGIVKNEQLSTAPSQDDSVLHHVLYQKEPANINIADIPKEILEYLQDILDPANCTGITPIIIAFEHIVQCLKISHLFVPPICTSSHQETVIKLEFPESESPQLKQLIGEHLRCKGKINDAQKILAVSIHCSEQTAAEIVKHDRLVFEPGNASDIIYVLHAFIFENKERYLSIVREGLTMYFKEKEEEDIPRIMFKTAQKRLSEKRHAFLLFIRNEENSGQKGKKSHNLCNDPSSKHSNEEKKKQTHAKNGASIRNAPTLPPPTQTKTSSSVSDFAASASTTEDKIQLTDELLRRVIVAEKLETAHYATINLDYSDELKYHLNHFRMEQMDIENKGKFLMPMGVVSEKLIVHSLAHQCRPQYEVFKHMAGWIYIDQLCGKLRTSTGFTHSLQSLELDPDDAIRAFKKPIDTLEEERYLQYHACRGRALMEAVKHYNKSTKKAERHIQALHVPENTGKLFSKQVHRPSKDLKQKIFAYMLYGMLEGLTYLEIQKLVIVLPVSAKIREEIIKILLLF
jgi:hypothetical protein